MNNIEDELLFDEEAGVYALDRFRQHPCEVLSALTMLSIISIPMRLLFT